MKIFSKSLLLVILALFVLNPLVLAKKTKLNLKLFDSPPDFSSDVSPVSAIMGTRHAPDNSYAPMRSASPAPCFAPCPAPSMPLSESVSITPDKAKVYNTAPVFEWKQPVCNKNSKCFVDIISEGIAIVNHYPVESNTYVFKDALLPKTTYSFKLSKSSEDMQEDLNLNFYSLSDEEKNKLASQLKQINDEDDYSKKVSELELLYQNAIWFDVVSLLNELIKQYPEDASLVEFKEKLYQTVQK